LSVFANHGILDRHDPKLFRLKIAVIAPVCRDPASPRRGYATG